MQKGNLGLQGIATSDVTAVRDSELNEDVLPCSVQISGHFLALMTLMVLMNIDEY